MINSRNFNNIRTVAMVFIIALHSTLLNFKVSDVITDLDQTNFNINFWQALSQAFYKDFFKSGTILFFIVSGFLFEMQINKLKVFNTFFFKKFKNLIVPYFFLFFIPTLIIVILIFKGEVASNQTVKFFFSRLIIEVFFGNYWFIPALFVTLMINYFINSKNLIKSFYYFLPFWILAYLNIYYRVTTTEHNVWFVAFFIMFTLGRIIYFKKDEILKISFLNNLKLMTILTFCFYLLSVMESMILLIYADNKDFTNTLRIFNVAYSFSFFMLLNKYFSVRELNLSKGLSLYFIYLIHPFVIRFTRLLIKKFHITFEYPSQFLFNILHFLLVFAVCVWIHKIFFKIKINGWSPSKYLFEKSE
jgi:fucose 4-O-acetylase-like acetyltransferase